MSKAHPPELKKFMDKKLSLKLNGGRHVQGILRGFDPFMNLVVDECTEVSPSGHQSIGMVICNSESNIPKCRFLYLEHGSAAVECLIDIPCNKRDTLRCHFRHDQVIRGNSIIMLEALERI